MDEIIEKSVIRECLKLFPAAVSEVEAVEMAAASFRDDAEKAFQANNSEAVMKIYLYKYLESLRTYLYDKRIVDLSGFKVGRN